MKGLEKRWIAAALSVCLLWGMCSLSFSVRAEAEAGEAQEITQMPESVTNATRDTALPISFGQEMEVMLTTDAQEQWFQISTEKAAQSIVIHLEKGTYISPRVFHATGEAIPCMKASASNDNAAYARTAGIYYIQFALERGQATAPASSFTFRLEQLGNDDYEPNDTIEEAVQLPIGAERAIIAVGRDQDWFRVTTEKPGQFIQIFCDNPSYIKADCYSADGELLATDLTGRAGVQAEAAGDYYLCFQNRGRNTSAGDLTLLDQPAYVSVALLDNDGNEPNNTRENATLLQSGQETEIILGCGDIDWFRVETTKPGQDISVALTGADYENNQAVVLSYEPKTDHFSGRRDYQNSEAYARLKGDSTLYFHASEAGEHYIALAVESGGVEMVTRQLTAQILDGDEHEANDSSETAAHLTCGTDAEFLVGGFGDEDWFSFDAIPDAETGKQLYTLHFSGLNTDYSDVFYYDVYAPDGSALLRKVKVNIQHTYGFAAEQLGLYYVRIYTPADTTADYYGSSACQDYCRSVLRICVSEGSDDPYENNETWQTAANIIPGEIQHVLSSGRDEDWFCFAVPEDGMTLHLTGSMMTEAELFRLEDLQKYSTEYCVCSGTFGGSKGDFYYMLGAADIYYLQLTTGSISPEIRTTGIQLLSATEEEPNDTWKTARTIYEGVPQAFTINGENDVDWFRLVIPEDDSRVRIGRTGDSRLYGLYAELYREKDFIETGDRADCIASDEYGDISEQVLNAGTYYLKYYYDSYRDFEPIHCSVTYRILPKGVLDGTNTSLEKAPALSSGKWTKFCMKEDTSYFNIGQHSAGEELRVSLDSTSGYWRTIALLSADGTVTGYFEEKANCRFHILEDGIYYIGVQEMGVRDNPLYRLRYDVGGGQQSVMSIESVDSLVLLEGERLFLDLRCAPYDGKTGGSNGRELFDVSAADCVSYDNKTGYLTAKSVGQGAVAVTLDGTDIKKEIAVTVFAENTLSVESLMIQSAAESMPLGQTVCLTVAYTLESGLELTQPEKAVTWESTDPHILYVDASGKVTAVGCGSAEISARMGDKTARVPIAVTAAEEEPDDMVTSLTLDRYSMTLYMGEGPGKLTAKRLPETSTAAVTWNTSNPKVAVVSSDGQITAVAPGSTIIAAQAGNRRISCVVSVLAARVRVTGVSFEEKEHEIPVGGSILLQAILAPEDATVKTLIWTCDQEDVVTVSRTGLITGRAVGTGAVRATTADGGFFAEIIVTVTAKTQLGDVNRDGYIDAADALLCLRSAVGLVALTAEQKAVADANHDGVIDAGDAIRILRFHAGLVDELN